jgi:hypothetical protein
MEEMMKLLLSAALAASAAVALSAPTLAQPYGPRPMGPPGMGPPAMGSAAAGWDIERRIHWLQERISRAAADGSLDRREMRRTQFQLDRIRRDAYRMRRMHGGRLWDRDRTMLEERLDRLSDSIRWMRNNQDYRRPW